MDLPVEVLDMVIQHLSKPEIKQLRQTCKRLAIVSVPSLFDTIFISRDSLDQEYAALALTQFKTSIKSVILCPLKYPKLIRPCYKRLVQRIRRRRAIPKYPRFDEHTDMGYKEYCRVQERAGHRSSWHKIEELLQRILMEAPSVYRVVLTHRNRVKDLTDLELAKYCQSETCRLPRELHALLKVTPLQSLETSRSSDVARAMFSIPPAGTRKIRELVMEPAGSSDGFFMVPLERFDEPSCFTFQVSVLMANLIKLRLDVDELPHHGDRSMQQNRILVRFLAQGKNLECLALNFRTSNGDTMFCRTLGGCQFPKLRILVLERAGMMGDELLPFIANSPRLKHLVLERCWLKGYRWTDLLVGIKAFGSLEALHFSHCYGGFGGPDWEDWGTWHYFVDLDKDVQNFLLRDGPNPFSLDKMAAYLAQYHNTRLRMRNADPPKFAQAYYHKYF